jgi:Protein of unknown function (DUF3152)
MTVTAQRAVLGIMVGLTVAVLLVAAGNRATDTQPAAAEDPVTTLPATTSGTAPPTTMAPTTSSSTSTTTTLVPGEVGVFTVAAGRGPVIGTGARLTYTVEVENAVGVPVEDFAAIVDATLADPRSWIADGSTSFRRVARGGQVRIVLATPPTVDQLCLPLITAGIYSCHQGGVVALNSDRWLHGTESWPGPLDQFRAYAVNHEMGHALGHAHEPCRGSGQLAPVMMQQSKGLEGCLPNGWPYP